MSWINQQHSQVIHRRGRVIDTSNLANIIKVESKTRTALVEPNVLMDRLVEATREHGLILPVVMEFNGSSVGGIMADDVSKAYQLFIGGFAGTAGESSSFKYGFFDRTISQIEIVFANGEIVMASGKDPICTLVQQAHAGHWVS